MQKNYPTQDKIRATFNYHQDGYLTYRISTSPRSPVDSRAGFAFDKKGYVGVSIDSKKYAAHRVIWIYHHGEIDGGMQIDHINQVKHDNRIENLRLVPGDMANKQNITLYANNTSGHLGVSFDYSRGKWAAKIKVKYKQIHLGRFEFLEDAVQARKAAELKYQPYRVHHG